MKLTRGVIKQAVKCCVYGSEGIGKSTLASHFPDPVFIDTEGSTSYLDVTRTERPLSWTMLMQQVDYFVAHPDELGTLVIDTMDWAERLCIDQILADKKIKGIEDIPYGKGYVYVAEEIGRLLNRLEDLKQKGVNVVLVAHAQMRKFEQPDELGSYDRWELKLSKKTAPLVKEAVDMLLFCNYKTMVVNVDGQGTQKGKNKAQGGRRVMYTQHHPCWDAKNRFGLPEELPMEWDAIAHIFGESATTPMPAKAAKAKAKPEMAKVAEPEPAQGVTAPPADEDPEVPAKSQEAPPAADPSVPSIGLFLSANLPDKLKQVMEADGVSEWEIQQVVYSRGYFPDNTPIEKMEEASPGFIEGWILQYWPQVKDAAERVRREEGVPFN